VKADSWKQKQDKYSERKKAIEFEIDDTRYRQ